MKSTIKKMFANAAPVMPEGLQLIDSAIPGHSGPLLECQVVLRGGFTVTGILTTDDDGLRLLTPAKNQRNEIVLVDHRFDHDDVMCIAVSVPANPQTRGQIIFGR
jgi:hypothetical protein